MGTKTITQNDSRIGGLDYIVSHNGTILEAISSMPWSGEAAVDVAIVNWIKGTPPEDKRKLARLDQKKGSSWKEVELDVIPSSLSFNTLASVPSTSFSM